MPLVRVDMIKGKTFEYPHSWDVGAEVVSRKASDVLRNKTGISIILSILWIMERQLSIGWYCYYIFHNTYC